MDDTDVLYCRIPDSILAIRIWSGGMERHRQYCFDFFDVVERVAMNTPYGYVISSYPTPGVFAHPGVQKSWEIAWGWDRDRIPAGTEKYCAIEGSRFVLTRPDKMPYYFEIPRRPSGDGLVFAQPQPGVPY